MRFLPTIALQTTKPGFSLNRTSRRKEAHLQMFLERLEERTLLSFTFGYNPATHVATATSAAPADALVLQASGGVLEYSANGAPFSADWGGSSVPAAADVTVDVDFANGTGSSLTIGTPAGPLSALQAAINLTGAPGAATVTLDLTHDALAHTLDLSSNGTTSTLHDELGNLRGDITYATAALQTLTINTNPAFNQTLNLNFGAGGNPIPSAGTPGLVFNTGDPNAGGLHTLNVSGELPTGAFASVTPYPNDPAVTDAVAQYGSITYNDGTGSPTAITRLWYSGLQPINDTTTTMNFIFNDFGTNPAFTIQDGPVVSGFSTIQFVSTPPSGPAQFETTTLANKTNVTINTTASTPYTAVINISGAATGLATLTVNGNSSGDIFNINATPSGVTTTINGGAGVNHFNLSNASEADGLDNLAGPVVIHGGASFADVVTLNDSDANFNDNYTVTSTTVSRIIFGGLTYDDNIGTLTLDAENNLGTNGNNTININSTAAFVTTNINGQGGIDTINVNSTGFFGELNVSTGANSGGTVNVVADNEPVNLNLDAEGTVNIGSTGGAGTMAGILGAIGITNVPAFYTLSFHDENDSTAHDWTLNNNDTGNTASVALSGGIATTTYRPGDLNSPLTLNGGSGGNEFIVNNTSSDYATTLNTGDGADAVSVAATGDNTLNINGQDGSDAVVLGGVASPVGAQNLGGTINITNTFDFTAVTVDDSQDTTARNVTVANNNTTGTVTGVSPATINDTDTDVGALNILGGSGGNTFSVNATTVHTTTTIAGGTGPNTYDLSSASEAGGLDNLVGPVVINGGGAGDTILLSDQDNTGAENYTLSATNLTGNDGLFGGLTYGNLGTGGSLTLDATTAAGGGGDTFSLLADSVPVSLNLNGPGGAVSVGSTGGAGTLANIQGAIGIVDNAGAYTLAFHDENDVTAHTWTLNDDDGANTASLALSGGIATTSYRPGDLASSVSFNAGSGGNAFSVNNTTANVETDINSGADNDTVQVSATGDNALVIDGQGGVDTVTLGGVASPVGMQDLGGSITVADTSGHTALTLDDSQDTIAQTVSLTDNATAGTITGLSPAMINYIDAAISAMVIDGGSGGNSFNLNKAGGYPTTLNAGTSSDTVNVTASGGGTFTINGQNGSDTVTLGGAPVGASAGGVQGFSGIVNITNSLGATALTLDDSQNTAAQNVSLNDSGTSGTITGLAPATFNFTDAALSALTIDGGSGGNTFTVNNTSALYPVTLNTGTRNDTVSVFATAAGSLTINGQAGSDLVTLGGVALPVGMQHLGGTINVANSLGLSALTLDDSEDATGRVATLSDNATTGTVTGLSPATINYTDSDTSALTILGGSGNNTFNVSGILANGFISNTPTTLNAGVKSSNTVNVTATNSGGVLNLPGSGSLNTLNYAAGANVPTLTAGAAPGEVIIAAPAAGGVDATQYANINITNVQVNVTPGAAQTLNAFVGAALTNVTLATFTLPASIQVLVGALPASAFTASIDWSDPSPDLTAGTIAAQSGSNPSQYAISGTHTFAAAGLFNVANALTFAGGTFPSTLNGVSVSVTLVSSGPTATTAATAHIFNPPAALAFTTQPAPTVAPGAVLAPIVVTIKDAQGNVEAIDDATVTLGIATGPAGATFTGASTTSVAAVNGVATFNNLMLSTSGAYTLVASDAADSLAGFDSGGFAVTTSTVLAPGQKFVYTDAHNAKVTVSFTSKTGTATIVRAQPVNLPGDALSIALSGTTTTSALAITATGGSGGGVTTLGQITDNAPINSIIGTGVNITGAGVIFSAGYANTLTLRALAAAAAISEPGANPTGVAVTLGAIGTGVSINLGSGAKTFTALDWSGTGSLTAPWLGTLKVSGSTTRSLAGGLGASLTLSGAGAPKGVALGSAAITGQITGGTWTIGGSTGAIAASATNAGWAAAITGAVTSITTKGAADGIIGAASITTLKVGADMGANVTLTADVSKKSTLGTLSVTGTLTDARIVSAGNIGTATLGAISGSSIYVGLSSAFLSGPAGLPTLGADFADLAATLGTLTVKGLSAAASFTDSIIGAGIVGTIKLQVVDTGDSGGNLFGIGGNSIASLGYTAGGKKVSLTKVTTESDPRLAGFPDGDFDVVIA